MGTIYKNEQAKKDLMSLYDEKLKSLNISYTKKDVTTQFGRTRIIKTGNPNGQSIVLFHGFNAGAPLTLEAIKELREDYTLYAIDTVGQTNKSEERDISAKDDSYGIWANQVIEYLDLKETNIIGISYGAFITQKLITYNSKRVAKCILVVPAGLTNGRIWESLVKLTFPLIRFQITKKEKHLKAFIKAFVPDSDLFMQRLLKHIMLGVHLNTKVPTLLKKKDVAHFNKPVFIMTASDDVFFPHDKVTAKSKKVFNNLKEIHQIQNCKHMPSKNNYKEIQSKIREWIEL